MLAKGDDDKKSIKRGLFDSLMKWLHAKDHFEPSMIGEKEPLEFIEDVNRVLGNAVKDGFADNVIPPTMKSHLEQSVYLFSGFKTMQELTEAGSLLRGDDGTIKPFSAFLKDVRAIDDKYNKSYLRSEYEFAVSSAQMAQRWSDYSDDALLQYRTANDSKVRETHEALHNVTLPKDDSFWDNYFAPNGWGCRCNVVEVSKSRHKASDRDDAVRRGAQAISSQGSKGKIFKFNPAKSKQIFPPKHPYYCRQMSSCSKVNLSADNDMCKGCLVIKELKDYSRKSVTNWAKENLINKKIHSSALEKDVSITMSAIKEYVNQPHKHYFKKNKSIFNIEEMVRVGRYVTSAPDHKNNPMISQYHYLETSISEETSYIVIREMKNGEMRLHSLTENIKR